MNTDNLFKAMSDPTRRRLLRLLTGHDLSVSEIVEVLEQPQSTISRHLKVLRNADLLIDRRLGSAVLYAARPPAPEPGGELSGTASPHNGNGLRGQILDWLRAEPLEPALERRLQRVLRRRGHDADFFETVGSRWDQLRIEAFGEAFYLEALTLLLPHDWVIADIGTGTGYLLPILAARFRTVLAIEPAGAMLEAARSRPELQSAANVEFRAGSLAKLPLRDAELDLAIGSLVLHHVPDPEAALRELRRCVRPGGRLLLIEQAAHEFLAFQQRMGDYWAGFKPEPLAEAVEKAGFAEVRLTPLAQVRPSPRLAGEVPGLFALTGRASE